MKRLRTMALTVAKALRPYLPDFRDLHVYGGGLLLAGGAWAIYPPAGPMAFGCLLLVIGLVLQRRS